MFVFGLYMSATTRGRRASSYRLCPQGGTEGPFLYLLVTLPLALAIEQDYPAYPLYPLLSPLLGFADDTNLTVVYTPHKPHAPDPRPTVTQEGQ